MENPNIFGYNTSMISSQDKVFMQMAVDKAHEGIQKGQTPFGACIVRDGNVLACEHNIVWQSTDITAHAEVNAIRQACRKSGGIDLSGATIYSTCEPCPMCFSAIHWARISRIVYGCGIDDAKEAGFNELCISNEILKKSGGLDIIIEKECLRDENRELFRKWIQSETKKAY